MKKENKLEELYNKIPQDLLGTVREIVDLEIELEADCNQ